MVTIRARQDVELAGADAEQAVEAIVALCDSLTAATGLPTDLVDAAVIGVPGVPDSKNGRVALTNIPGLDGRRFAPELEDRLGLPVTVENDINLAALGERWQGVARGVDDFVFLSVGTGLGAGLVLHGELHRGRNGAAGELDVVASACRRTSTRARLRSRRSLRGWRPSATGVVARAAVRPALDLRAARAGDGLALDIVAEEARRIALHVVPIAAVADVALVVLGGGLGANGDLLCSRSAS